MPSDERVCVPVFIREWIISNIIIIYRISCSRCIPIFSPLFVHRRTSYYSDGMHLIASLNNTAKGLWVKFTIPVGDSTHSGDFQVSSSLWGCMWWIREKKGEVEEWGSDGERKRERVRKRGWVSESEWERMPQTKRQQNRGGVKSWLK